MLLPPYLLLGHRNRSYTSGCSALPLSCTIAYSVVVTAFACNRNENLIVLSSRFCRFFVQEKLWYTAPDSLSKKSYGRQLQILCPRKAKADSSRGRNPFMYHCVDSVVVNAFECNRNKILIVLLSGFCRFFCPRKVMADRFVSHTSNLALLPPQDAQRLAFKKAYLKLLLPVVAKIRERSSANSFPGQLRAVKFAVNMSLVLTATRVRGSNRWRRAFKKELLRKKGWHHPWRGKNGRNAQSLFPWRRMYMQSLRRSCFRLHRGGLFSNVHKRKERQMKTFRRLIPGGAAMDVAELLEEAIHYVAALQSQVEALQSLMQALQA